MRLGRASAFPGSLRHGNRDAGTTLRTARWNRSRIPVPNKEEGMKAMSEYLLRAVDIVKTFAGVKALQGVSLDI